MKCILLFRSVHQVMRAEKLLKGKGFEVSLIPVPREISSDCGVAIEFLCEERREVLSMLEASHISILESYIRNQDGEFEKESSNPGHLRRGNTGEVEQDVSSGGGVSKKI
jgi:hypothetical protein